MSNAIPFFTADDIVRALPMREAIAVVQEAYRQLSSGEALAPLRTALALPHGVTLVMPAATRDAVGVKVVSIRDGNALDGLPTVPALMMLADAKTGLPRALLDGTHLTRLRTGAAVGVATDLLARGDARTLTMIGAGALAPFCIEAVCAVRSIEQIRVYSRTEQSVERVMQWCRERRLPIVLGDTQPVSSLVDADIVICATNSPTPVFEGNQLSPGAHVCALGSYRPDMQEVDAVTVRRARVFVDSRAACLQETGDLMIPIVQGLIEESHIYAELGEVLAGLRAGRERDDEITLFKSVGNAVQDVAVAAAVTRPMTASN